MSAFVESEEILTSESYHFGMETAEERQAYFVNLMVKQNITGVGKRIYIEYLIDVKKSEAFLIRLQDLEVLEEMLKDEKEKPKQ